MVAPARHGMVVAPHRLASAAGLRVLENGGDAVEAAVATAAALCVLYPHMTGLGGDAFWLVAEPGAEPVAILGCGGAARAADLDFYLSRNHAAIPARGGLAALTTAGAPASWAAALGGRPLAPLLQDAIAFAAKGAPVSRSLALAASAKHEELRASTGWAEVFAPNGMPVREGDILRLPRLADTLTALAAEGVEDFYRGGLARRIAADLAEIGSPVSADDLASQAARVEKPLKLRLADCHAYNCPAPTQGLAALIILALQERLPAAEAESFAWAHGIVEATKRAFRVRDLDLGDPAYMQTAPQALLDDGATLDRWASEIDMRRAAPWPHRAAPGDTVWLGVIDGDGRAVSMIQSLYFEFGAGVVLPRTGLLWQNRGASFRLADSGWNALKPGRLPFHTLCPAMARFDDGRVLVYGTMGGDGQPQTQAAVFTRYARHGQGLAEAIAAPRWLLGRTWGDTSTALRVEEGFPESIVAALSDAGHPVQRAPAHSEVFGHAGAIVRAPDGVLEGGADPRSDGGVAC